MQGAGCNSRAFVRAKPTNSRLSGSFCAGAYHLAPRIYEGGGSRTGCREEQNIVKSQLPQSKMPFYGIFASPLFKAGAEAATPHVLENSAINGNLTFAPTGAVAHMVP